jgi:hypothetical protein
VAYRALVNWGAHGIRDNSYGVAFSLIASDASYIYNYPLESATILENPLSAWRERLLCLGWSPTPAGTYPGDIEALQQVLTGGFLHTIALPLKIIQVEFETVILNVIRELVKKLSSSMALWDTMFVSHTIDFDDSKEFFEGRHRSNRHL